jgi:hypothetical protein
MQQATQRATLRLTLDIVVETGDDILVLVQQPLSVLEPKVFKLASKRFGTGSVGSVEGRGGGGTHVNQSVGLGRRIQFAQLLRVTVHQALWGKRKLTNNSRQC